MSDLERLGQIVELEMLVSRLDERLQGMARSGEVGQIQPAGAAAPAMIGAGLALGPEDFAFGTARDLPLALARGVSLGAACSQILSSAGDPSLGRGLPGAVCDGSSRTSLTDGSAAAHLVHAAGYGLAAQLRGEDTVALAIFGTAAQEHGELHAALNFAAVYRSRCVFVARGPLLDAVPFEVAAEAWGIRANTVDGTSGVSVLGAVMDARARAVAGEGPTLIDARYREDGAASDAGAFRDAGGFTGERSESQMRAEVMARIEEALTSAARQGPVPMESLGAAVVSEGMVPGSEAPSTEGVHG